MNLPVDIYSVSSVRRIDQAAINDAGIPGYTLMTRAGSAAVDAAIDVFPQAKRWQVICGPGNNGGDGYVVARLAAERGISVTVIAAVAPETLAGDAATACRDFASSGGVIEAFQGALDNSAGLLIDGLLGSGLQRPVEGRFAAAVEAINTHSAPVMALDIPSGVHGDSGLTMGTSVVADLTLTFVALKCGLLLGDGPSRTGRLLHAGLGIPDECYQRETPLLRRMNDSEIRMTLPPRRPGAHKGDFGHVLVVGGGPGMPGAVRLCGEAALRSGAGLVSIATHPTHSALVPLTRPELMCHGVASAQELAPLIDKASVIAVGPGLGAGNWAKSLLGAVLDSDRPVVVDADALNLVAQGATRNGSWTLTPHPGEAARLLGVSSIEIQADRRAALVAMAKKYSATVVLKGAGTLVSVDQGAPWLCSAGNPGMASPGMGDALTGIISGLRAQGLSEETAAVTGVLIHAQAGDVAAAAGERGLLASDLIDAIRGRVNQ